MAATVIVGGGAIGSSIAYWLTRHVSRTTDILVIERDLSYRQASTTLAAASIRQQFSTPLNVELSHFGWQFLLEAGGKGGAAVQLVENPYLFLADEAAAPLMRARAALSRSLGLEVREFSPQDLARDFPWLDIDRLSCGTRSVRNEGFFDGTLLLQWLRGRAVEAGARYIAGEVVGIDTNGQCITAVRLKDGRYLAAEHVINAAGPWAAPIAALVGVSLPVCARRRSVFVFSCPTSLPGFPILIDTSGVYVRADQRRFLCLLSPPPHQDADDLPLEADYSLFDEQIWPALAARVPAFESLRVEASWAGYYEYSAHDQNGFIGQIGPENFFVACGFSGHGLMHSPGIGRGVAELVAGGGYRTLDLSMLAPQRIAQARRICEDAIY